MGSGGKTGLKTKRGNVERFGNTKTYFRAGLSWCWGERVEKRWGESGQEKILYIKPGIQFTL